MTRREAAKVLGGAAMATMIGGRDLLGQAPQGDLITRSIPSSGEKLPVIGLGTYQSFDADPAGAARTQLTQVLKRFVELGGKVIDSSPMYGKAEATVGALARDSGVLEQLFVATKVWTRGKDEGMASMRESIAKLRVKKLDLMQVHNLVDVETHLATLRQWKEQGLIRYLGITHYTESAYPEVARLLEREKLDFLQINYSIGEREADKQLLPLAHERGVAVIANRPLGGGNLFSRVRGKQLPDYAKEFGCNSWAQFFLKWIVANPAVTCAIPATSKPRHLEDNMQACYGALPDAKMQQRMAEEVSGL